MEYYVYVWRDANGVPFYVGKGTGRRAYALSGRSQEFIEIYDRGGCCVEIVDWFIHESQAHAREVELIAFYGRKDNESGPLVNKTDGGEGTVGLIGLSGAGNGNYNDTVFHWINYRTMAEERASLFEMHSKYGASRASWTSVSAGYRPSIKGWLLFKNLNCHKGSDKGQIFSFVNRDGRSFSGTQGEFCEFAGTTVATAHRVATEGSVSRCGWRLAGVEDRQHNCPKSGDRPGKSSSIYTISNGNITVSGDAHKIAAAIGGTPQRVWAGLYGIKSGRAKTYMGWSLVSHGSVNGLAA